MKSFYLFALFFLVFVLAQEPEKAPKYKYILKTSLSQTEVQELLADKGKVKEYKKKYEKKHKHLNEENVEKEIEKEKVNEKAENNNSTTVLVSKEEKLAAIKEKSEQKVQAIKDKEEIKEAEIEAKEEKEEANSEAKKEKKEKSAEAKDAKKEAKNEEKEDKKDESLKKDLIELIQTNQNEENVIKPPEITMFSYFFGMFILSCFIGLFIYATQYSKINKNRINNENNYLIHNSNEYKKDDDYQNMRDF